MNTKVAALVLVVVAILLTGYVIISQTISLTKKAEIPEPSPSTNTTETPQPQPEETKPVSDISLPIADAGSRITKKSFGTYVTPKNSPVSPEKFTGYHTGLDFETFENEATLDVEIKAICSGKILRKTTATGYGGYIVQECTINNSPVTIVYGHLRLSSITAKVNEELKSGQKIGLLGTGYSTETSGERKHLHLSIHSGIAIDIKGYVSADSALNSWLDPKTILGL